MAEAARRVVAEAPRGTPLDVPAGLVGVTRARRFVLERGGPDVPFWLLCAIDVPRCRFIACDTGALWPAHADEARRASGANADALVLALVSRRSEAMTANLLAPIVVELGTGTARQVVLEGSRYRTRHALRRPAQI